MLTETGPCAWPSKPVNSTIKREKATSNICTAQALLANMAAMYAVYHGAEGLKNIATRTSMFAHAAATALEKLGYTLASSTYFDTITINTADAKQIVEAAAEKNINLRLISHNMVGISFDETSNTSNVTAVIDLLR